jgi:hypothetical protein
MPLYDDIWAFYGAIQLNSTAAYLKKFDPSFRKSLDPAFSQKAFAENENDN